MSSITSVVYGVGFEVGDVDSKTLVKFIKNHEKAFCEREEDIALFDILENLVPDELEEEFEAYECDCSGREGFGAAISNIISRETNIRVQFEPAQGDCNGEPSVLFTEGMPWGYNEVEKNLTFDSLVGILTPYAVELGIAPENIEFLNIEYCG